MTDPIGNIQPTAAVGVAPPAYGSESPRPLSIVIDLSAARDNEKLSISGNFLWAQEGSDATAKLGIGFQSGDQYVNFYPGTAISGPQFGDVYLTNTGQAGKWIKLVALKGDPQQLRIQNPVQVFNDVNVLTMPDVTLVAGQSIDIGSLPDYTDKQLPGFYISKNSQSFSDGFRAPYVIGAATGQTIAVQLFNPAASGVYLILREIFVRSDLAGDVTLYTGNGAQTTAITSGYNKYAGGPYSKGSFYKGTAGPTGSDFPKRAITVAATQWSAMGLSNLEPHVCPPGYGFDVVFPQATGAQNFQAGFDWDEVIYP